ncbi:Retinol dehydrogenase 10-B [Balamuthia mandrillaris]
MGFLLLLLLLVAGVVLLLWWCWLRCTRPVPRPAHYFNQRTVLITGGARGLGRAIAEQARRLGATLVLLDSDAEALRDTVEGLSCGGAVAGGGGPEQGERSGARVHGYCCDVTDRKQVYAMAERVQAEVGSVDVLVNNAGVVTTKTLFELSDAEFENTAAVNFLSHFWTVRAFLPQLLLPLHKPTIPHSASSSSSRDKGGHEERTEDEAEEEESAHIVTISSVLGLVGGHRIADYSSSKFAAFSFAECLRLELRKMEKHDSSALRADVELFLQRQQQQRSKQAETKQKEKKRRKIDTSLVCPWHIDTDMFDGLKLPWYTKMLLPTLRKERVAEEVIKAILGRKQVVIMPNVFWLVGALRTLLPVSLFDWLLEFSGSLDALDGFARLY